MITYEKYPISAAEASRISTWLTSSEANLFKQCMSARMHAYSFDSLNHQARKAETEEDSQKFSRLSSSSLDKAMEIMKFIRMMEDFSKPEHGFFKIKVNT